MTNEYSLWKVTFSYEVPGERAENWERTVYTVVGADEDEAEKKSLADFSRSEVYQYIHADLHTTVTKIKKRKITKPELTLEEDQENFMILPRLVDNNSLEFIVTERKGR